MLQYVIYVLDKVVWMLLIAIFTTQALQIAGIIDTPQTLGEITYTEVKIFVQVCKNFLCFLKHFLYDVAHYMLH